MLHDGHRKRIRATFFEYGFDIFNDHNVLELLLFSTISRGDTNPIAHRLINKFGSLNAVFNASVDELMEVSGIGRTSAAFIKLIPELTKRYAEKRSDALYIISTPADVFDIIRPHITDGANNAYLLCLDGKGKLLNLRPIFAGDLRSERDEFIEIVKNIIYDNATAVIIARSYSGKYIASDDDIAIAAYIQNTLSTIDIVLIDNIMVSEDDYYSFASAGFLSQIRE